MQAARASRAARPTTCSPRRPCRVRASESAIPPNRAISRSTFASCSCCRHFARRIAVRRVYTGLSSDTPHDAFRLGDELVDVQVEFPGDLLGLLANVQIDLERIRLSPVVA